MKGLYCDNMKCKHVFNTRRRRQEVQVSQDSVWWLMFSNLDEVRSMSLEKKKVYGTIRLDNQTGSL